jgi:hypothetical protein
MSRHSKNILLVEGQSDLHFAIAFLQELGLTKNDVDVMDKGGYDNLRREARTNLKQSQLERVGIIVDADDPPESRWQSLKDALEQIGYRGISPDPVPGGLVIAEDGFPILGIWMMPDNRALGKVEHLFCALISAENELLARAVGALADIPAESAGRFAEKDRIKAEVHTWIAWGDIPELPLGQAATHHGLVGSPAGEPFRNWLRRLFDVAA